MLFQKKIFKRLTGEEAFKAENDEELYKKILKGQYDQKSANYQSISLNARVIK
jgi:hypothetical protein